MGGNQLDSRLRAAIAVLSVIAIAALNLTVFTNARHQAWLNRQNLRGAQLTLMRALRENDDSIPAEMDLASLITHPCQPMTNPYTGRPVKYVPFGADPSPGDITGFIADSIYLNTFGPGFPARTELIPRSGYYLFIFGPPGQGGLDINWDGRPDHIVFKLQTSPIWGVATAKEDRLKPLDLLFDEHGIAHGPAPNTRGQCAWGKPCVETSEWCPICDGEVAESTDSA